MHRQISKVLRSYIQVNVKQSLIKYLEKTKATEWGIANKRLDLKSYLEKFKHEHKKKQLISKGFLYH